MSKIVFITGATSGIGKSCAEKFAAAGHTIIITGRRQERLTQVAEELRSRYAVEVISLCFDVQDNNAVVAAVASLPTSIKQVDILVNNAGLALGKESFATASLQDWDTMLHTNVNGLLYVSKAVLPLLQKSEAGHIINIGSTAGKEVYENGNIYCASKFAVDAITKGMRIDLLPEGIKVTAVNPGAAETEFSKVRFHGDEEKAAAAYKGYEPLSPDDIAEAVYYCSSLPLNVCINDLTLTSLAQANSFYIHKKDH